MADQTISSQAAAEKVDFARLARLNDLETAMASEARGWSPETAAARAVSDAAAWRATSTDDERFRVLHDMGVASTNNRMYRESLREADGEVSAAVQEQRKRTVLLSRAEIRPLLEAGLPATSHPRYVATLERRFGDELQAADQAQSRGELHDASLPRLSEFAATRLAKTDALRARDITPSQRPSVVANIGEFASRHADYRVALEREAPGVAREASLVLAADPRSDRERQLAGELVRAQVALAAVRDNSDALAQLPPSEVSRQQAEALARTDAALHASFEDDAGEMRHLVEIAMGESASRHPEYRRALEATLPELAAAADRAWALQAEDERLGVQPRQRAPMSAAQATDHLQQAVVERQQGAERAARGVGYSAQATATPAVTPDQDAANSGDFTTRSRTRELAMSGEEAVTVAERDIAEERDAPDDEKRVLAEAMADRAALSPAYRRALGNLAPELMQSVEEVEEDRVTRRELRAREPEAATWRDQVARGKAREDIAEYELQAEFARDGELDEVVERIRDRSVLSPSYHAELAQAAPRIVEALRDDEATRVLKEAAAEAPEVAPQVARQSTTPGRDASQTARDAQSARARAQAVDVELELDEEESEKEVLRKKRLREAGTAALEENSVDVRASGRELTREEIVMPRRIVNNYSQVDGKFFAKDSNRVMFEDKGAKIATSTVDKSAIEDMVALARAKQWQTLKLTGSQEFRREAWLQAESQGIKTQGFTPKDADIAALKTLTAERATNTITPIEEQVRKGPGKERSQQQAAPRHNLNKNQASMHSQAQAAVAGNLQALREKPAFAGRSVEELSTLAYWRGMVQVENAGDEKRSAKALERFDAQAADPSFASRLAKEARTAEPAKTKSAERVQRRDTPEQTL